MIFMMPMGSPLLAYLLHVRYRWKMLQIDFHLIRTTNHLSQSKQLNTNLKIFSTKKHQRFSFGGWVWRRWMGKVGDIQVRLLLKLSKEPQLNSELGELICFWNRIGDILPEMDLKFLITPFTKSQTVWSKKYTVPRKISVFLFLKGDTNKKCWWCL